MKLLLTVVWAAGLALAAPAYATLSTQGWCPNTTLLGFAWGQGCFSTESTSPGVVAATSPVLPPALNTLGAGDPGFGLAPSQVFAANAPTPLSAHPVKAPASLPLLITGLVALTLRSPTKLLSKFHHYCRGFTL